MLYDVADIINKLKSKIMTVDFNNLRKQTAFALDDVIKTLNAGILPETTFDFIDKDGKSKAVQGDVLVFKEDLQNDLDRLRNCVWTLLCCFEEGNPNYQCVFEDVEASGGLARFNDEDER